MTDLTREQIEEIDTPAPLVKTVSAEEMATIQRVTDGEAEPTQALRDLMNQPANNGHEWGVIGNITMCKKCGWMKDGKNAGKPCKGSSGISLRGTSMTEDQIKHMADRFLGWRLPKDFSPDAGISFKPTFNDHMPAPMRHEPVGTNLFDAAQTAEMVRYMVEGL